MREPEGYRSTLEWLTERTGKGWLSTTEIAALLGVDRHIRFTAMVTEKMLKDTKYVRLSKTNNHIIVTPISAEWKAEDNPWAIPVYFVDNSKAAFISMTRLVKSEGWLSRTLFGNKRYKVKRDKKGKIYICLNEVVE